MCILYKYFIDKKIYWNNKTKKTRPYRKNKWSANIECTAQNKERIQVFEGIIIKKQGGGVNATFTVRRISYGVGVEKTFLVHSPMVEKVEVVRVGKARRAKLYYLRDRVGKAAKTKEKVGARIEDREIVVKEEIVPGESVAEEVVTEESVAEAVEAVKAEEAAKAAAEEVTDATTPEE